MGQLPAIVMDCSSRSYLMPKHDLRPKIGLGKLAGMGRSVFTPSEFDAFVEKLEQETGIQIIQVVYDEKNEIYMKADRDPGERTNIID